MIRACTLAAIVTVTAACGRTEVDTRGGPTTLTMVNVNGGWHPRVDADGKLLVTLPLVSTDSAGNLKPRLAESWEHSSDYRTWTVHLRPDVTWHDGLPFTAHDIAFTVDMWNDPVVHFWAGGTVDSVTVIDDHTVRLVYHDPQQLDDWWDYWPEHAMRDLDRTTFWDWEYWGTPIGNGPYRVVRYEPDRFFELEANPDYYAGPPKIDRLILRQPRLEAAVELLAGNADLAVVNPSDLPKLREDPRFVAYPRVGLGRIYALYWNLEHELFRDVAVRKALTHAIDRRELLAVINYPDDVPIVDWPFTRRQYTAGTLPQPLPFDAVRAKQLLASAGWIDSDGDEIRERNNRTFRFEALLPDNPFAFRVATFVQEALRDVGVQMDLSTISVVLLEPKVSNPEFEAAFFSMTNVQQGWMGHDSIFGRESQIGYRNPTMHRLLNEARATIDPEALDRVYDQIVELCREDLPVTFISPQVMYVVAHRKVRGFPPVLTKYPMAYVEDLWIEEEP